MSLINAIWAVEVIAVVIMLNNSLSVDQQKWKELGSPILAKDLNGSITLADIEHYRQTFRSIPSILNLLPSECTMTPE
jgi:hypothetical protein